MQQRQFIIGRAALNVRPMSPSHWDERPAIRFDRNEAALRIQGLEQIVRDQEAIIAELQRRLGVRQHMGFYGDGI